MTEKSKKPEADDSDDDLDDDDDETTEQDEDADADGADEEEDDDADEEDDDADEEDDAKPPLAAGPPIAGEGEDPSWWLPHLVLGVLVLVGVMGFFGAFTSLLGPMLYKHEAAPAPSASASATPSAKAPIPARSAPGQAPQAPSAAPAAEPLFTAKQILVQWKDGEQSKQSRTKPEAKKRADEAAAKIKGGAKFEEVVGEFSDEEGAAPRGGSLGRFKRGVLPPNLQEALEKTSAGQTTPVVETPRGYHILLRAQ